MKCLLWGFLVGASLLLSGCVSTLGNPGIRTRAYLYDAYHAWETGENPKALLAIQAALASSECEKVPSDVLIEVYDDAGLYFSCCKTI